MTKAQMKLFWENPLTVWVMRSLILSMVTLCAYGFFYLLDGKYESKDHALKARSEMFDKFESRIEAQNVAFQERLESHANDENVHMPYDAKVDRFVTRPEWVRSEALSEHTDATIREEIREGFKEIREQQDRRFDQLADMIQSSR